MVSSARPFLQAATICRAARRASMDKNGIEPEIENQAEFARVRPEDALR